MKIIPHILYNELQLPEFFDLPHQGDRLALLLSSLQSGSHKLLINLSGLTPPDEPLGHEALARIGNTLLHALENSRDPAQMIAVIAPIEFGEHLRLLIHTLEDYSYDTRLFEDRQQAHHWFGA